MAILYILIAISLTIALLFLVFFLRSVKQGQFDDTYTPSVRILFEDEIKSNHNKTINPQTTSHGDSKI